MKLQSEDLSNRFGFHKGTEVTGPQHQEVRKMFENFANLLNRIIPEGGDSGRAKAVMFTELENASMWANKAIANQAPVVNE